jgi:hypothetical protein
MGSEQILKDLKAERDRLQTVIDILEKPSKGSGNGRRRKRTVSAAARRRISEAMRKRWELRKKAGKTSL